ncbi:MAG: sigma-70 family RNA polymerase sigma factor [Eubacterium sp.]|nr:sigma-70 family RNA polymerase sigma factor [Eubacterium sp.]
MEDKQIIDLFFNRNETAIRELNEKYGKLFRNVAHNILEDYDDSEECVNDTYLKVWNSIPPQNPEYLCAYVCKIVRNNSLNMLKKRNAQKRSNQQDVLLSELEECLASSNEIDDAIDEKHLVSLINAWLKKQSDLSKQLFIFRYFAMDSVESISEKYSISKNSVSVKLHRLRASLKSYLESEDIFNG